MSTMQIEKFYWTIVVEFIGLKLVESWFWVLAEFFVGGYFGDTVADCWVVVNR
jgi:hypothetical protein